MKMHTKNAIQFVDNKYTELYRDYDRYNRIMECAYNIIDVYTPIILYELNIEDENIIINLDRYNIQPGYDVWRDGFTQTSCSIMHNVTLYIETMYINYSYVGGNILSFMFACIVTLAHELRHVYQKKYKLFLYEDKTNYNLDTWGDYKSEQDAESYSDYFIDKHNYDIGMYLKIYYNDLYEEDISTIIRKRLNNKLTWKESDLH